MALRQAQDERETLAETADRIEAMLEDAGRAAGTYGDDPQGWHARHRAEMRLLGERLGAAGIGAMLTTRGDGARFRCRGLAATSTSGVVGAIRNWLRRARERSLDEARDERA